MLRLFRNIPYYDCLAPFCRCGYCERVASRVVTVDEGWRREMMARFEKAMATLITGEIAGLHV